MYIREIRHEIDKVENIDEKAKIKMIDRIDGIDMIGYDKTG